MPDNDKDSRVTDPKEKLLKQIRDDFSYVRSYWHDNYEEAAKDMDCVACIPPSDFTKDRSGRPCIWPDETSQYVNQANNNLRQNQRGIKLSPKSDDATAKDAEHRQSYIQGIQDASKFPAVASTAFESAVECGFGFWRITTLITGPKGEQEPRIKRIPNWATVYLDPDAKEADFSDGAIAFVIDSMRESTFARKYPKAQKRSFSPEDREVAHDWFPGGNVIVAEYWTREEIEAADGEVTHKVTQRITNGVEILEEHEWLGSRIPIVAVLGKELYVKSGGQSKRLFFSMIRRGRPAQQMMAYIASQEAEEFGMAPRAPFVGYKGMFVNAEKTWKLVNKVPMAYLEVDLPVGWPAGVAPPPLPTRPQFTPNPEAYEIAYERWRRSHQASVAGNPLPTDAQKLNDKSGVALERIENAGMLGNFHFTDNFVRALHNTGEQLDELITRLAETDSLPDQVLGKDQKNEDKLLKVAPRAGLAPQASAPQSLMVPPEESEHLPESEYFFAHRGKFAVTISDGPNYQSQREEMAMTADLLVKELPALGLPPQITSSVLAIAIKMKNIGTYGDEIADLLSPPDPNKLSPQAKAILAHSQGTIQELKAELQKLQMEKLGKVTEQQGKMAVAQLDAQTKMAEADKDRETKVLIAEIMTKAQSIEERMSAWEDLMKQLHGQAHDIAMAMQEQKHAKELADQQAQAAQEQQITQAALQPPPASGAQV